MKYLLLTLLSASCLLMTVSCNNNKSTFDASGSFEAIETIISSEAQGVLRNFDIEEGQTLNAKQQIGYIDSVQLFLKKKQLEAQITSIVGRKPNIPVQLSALEQQLKTAEHEKLRIVNLLKGDAATPKQVDDINAQIDVIKKQIDGQKSTLIISSEGMSKDAVALRVQIAQLEDQLKKCSIINPIKGTVLTKYTEANEIVTIGKPLYKIADLSNIILRVYISSDQLARVKINQKVTVLTDDGKGDYRESAGTVIWISDKAEFTPKTIQTKNERANMVYAMKVKVANDGIYKIGMYGEIKF